MRLRALVLDRYGPFTGRRLDFRPDARLHVVLGPNEAGKSCALAAVTDLLFGIEHQTRLDFLHREEGLRLGADIMARDGRTLAFFRRKGRKNLLSDTRGAALPDDALGPFLGGLTRSVFCNAFGMNAEVLRAGAKEMLRSDGEVGTTLFAAASGLRGYRDLARTLGEEAGEIFAPAARKRKLNEALGRYEEARKATSAERIGAEGWRRLGTEVADADARLASVRDRRRALAAEGSRLRRLKAVAPVLALIDAREAESAEFLHLPEMDDPTVADLVGRTAAAAEAEAEVARAEATLAAAERELAAVALDRVVEPHAAAIARLVERIADHQRSVRDLPRVEREAEEKEAALGAIARRLGLADAAAAEAALPTDAARAGLKALLTEGRALAAERVRIERDLARHRDERLALTRARDERGPLTDPGPWRNRLDALAPVLAETGRRAALAAEIARDGQALETAQRRLAPPSTARVSLLDASLPTVDAIRRAGGQLADAERERDRLRERVAVLAEERRKVVVRMDARHAARLPDPDALSSARRERDAAWVGTRAAALGAPEAPAGADLLVAIAMFERTKVLADDLADRLLDDAARAAEQAADGRRRDDLAREIGAFEASVAEADRVTVTSRDEWLALWSGLGLTPGPADEMVAWRGAVAALAQRRDALDARRVELAGLNDRIEAVRPTVEAIAAGLALPSMPGLDLTLAAERIAARLRALADTWEAARDATARLSAAEAAIVASEADAAAAKEKGEDWAGRWRDALACMSLPPGTDLDGAEAALAAWNEVPGQLAERANRRARALGIRRDLAEFDDEVRHVLVLLDLRSDRAAPDAVRDLQRRAIAAREAGTLHAAHAAARSVGEAARDLAAAAAGQAGERLLQLTARFAIPAGTDLPGLAARFEERSRLRADLRRARSELARTGDGVAETALRDELAATHADAIEGRLAEIAATEEHLTNESNVAFADRERLRTEQNRIESGTGAETAAARRNAAEAEARALARRYVVLQLGALLLGAAVERHRAGQQDPLLQRAGELFGSVTGGAYLGLDQAYDADDQPVLKGRRAAGGATVAVGDMSEGTRDQLFLALRLAYLEDYARRAEPAPFVGDDIFASFDDDRTGHGLEALAAIGPAVQPILFTHHASVARLAEAQLGPAADVISIG